MQDESCLITFRLEEDEEDVRVAARVGENLLAVARRGRIPVFAPCDGNGSCGKCRVRILNGKLRASKSFYIADVEYDEGWRLACMAHVMGDATLLVRD